MRRNSCLPFKSWLGRLLLELGRCKIFRFLHGVRDPNLCCRAPWRGRHTNRIFQSAEEEGIPFFPTKGKLCSIFPALGIQRSCVSILVRVV